MVNVRVPPAGMLPSAQGNPAGQSPAVPTNVSPLGSGTVTSTFAASDGPLLVTVAVNVMVVPGVAAAGPVCVTCTSACGVSAAVAVLLLLPAGSFTPTGAVTVAVLVSEPVAVAAMVPVAVNVAVPPLSRSTVVLMSPAPSAAQLEPALALQVQVTALSVAGNRSLTVAAVTALGPAFDTVMV